MHVFAQTLTSLRRGPSTDNAKQMRSGPIFPAPELLRLYKNVIMPQQKAHTDASGRPQSAEVCPKFTRIAELFNRLSASDRLNQAYGRQRTWRRAGGATGVLFRSSHVSPPAVTLSWGGGDHASGVQRSYLSLISSAQS